MKLLFDDVDSETFKDYTWEIRSIKYYDKNNVYYFSMNWELIEIKWVDLNSFKKIDDSTYEDKNYNYELISGHYWA